MPAHSGSGQPVQRTWKCNKIVLSGCMWIRMPAFFFCFRTISRYSTWTSVHEDEERRVEPTESRSKSHHRLVVVRTPYLASGATWHWKKLKDTTTCLPPNVHRGIFLKLYKGKVPSSNSIQAWQASVAVITFHPVAWPWPKASSFCHIARWQVGQKVEPVWTKHFQSSIQTVSVGMTRI